MIRVDANGGAGVLATITREGIESLPAAPHALTTPGVGCTTNSHAQASLRCRSTGGGTVQRAR